MKAYKLGRKTIQGWVLELVATKTKFLLVPCRHNNSHKDGRPSITAARSEKVETWPINPSLFEAAMSEHKPEYVVFFLTDTDDLWLSNVEDWRDTRKRIYRMTKSGRPLYHLPSHFFRHLPDKEPLRLA